MGNILDINKANAEDLIKTKKENEAAIKRLKQLEELEFINYFG